MNIEPTLLRSIIESALMAYGQPLSIEKLQTLFVDDKSQEDPKSAASSSGTPEAEADVNDESEKKSEKSVGVDNVPSKEAILEALESIQQSCEDRGFELKQVSSGWRFQVRADMARWVNRLWEEKPQRYSRALLETLSIIAYRQPITRGDIEEIRGVAVSSHIIKTLTEREWIKVVGHRDVPGRPSLFATTRQFLDYFNLESLDELPSLRELADIDSLSPELDLQPTEGESTGESAEDGEEVLVTSDGQEEFDVESSSNETELDASSEELVEFLPEADLAVVDESAADIPEESTDELAADEKLEEGTRTE